MGMDAVEMGSVYGIMGECAILSWVTCTVSWRCAVICSSVVPARLLISEEVYCFRW